ncbi:hypothetical protein ACLK1T_27340 [Escherichia coli]
MSELLSAALLDMRWHRRRKRSNAGCRYFELRALVAENMDFLPYRHAIAAVIC